MITQPETSSTTITVASSGSESGISRPPVTPEPTVIPDGPCTDVTQQQNPVFEFGIRGGIPPHTVKIFGDGRLEVEGATIRDVALSPITVKALIELANGVGFWMLPVSSGHIVGWHTYQFIQITLPCTSRRVEFHGTANDGPFAELYALLSELTGVGR